MELHNDRLEANSSPGNVKQEITELKEQLQRWSCEEQHLLIAEMVGIAVDELFLPLSFENISVHKLH